MECQVPFGFPFDARIKVHFHFHFHVVITFCNVYISSQMDVAWVVGRNECYPPHPGSTLVSDMMLL